ncbi:hypothetical protein BU17DRAFT_65903 [Hysterangium stoloniferum]|nr:hypothetical protein BU17DRAFT_65903 [Hysterangium stoloniferum]
MDPTALAPLVQPVVQTLIHGGRHIVNSVSPSKNREKADECLSSGNEKIKDLLARIDPEDLENFLVVKDLVDINSECGHIFSNALWLHVRRINLQAASRSTLGNIRSVKESHSFRQDAKYHLKTVHVTSQGIEAGYIARTMRAALAMASPQPAGKLTDMAKSLPTSDHLGHAAAQIGVSCVHPPPRDNIPTGSTSYRNDYVYPSFEGAGGAVRQTGPNNSLEMACVEPRCAWKGFTVKDLQAHRFDQHISCCGKSFPSGNTRAHHLARCGLYLNAFVKYAPNASEDTGMPHANPSGGHPVSSTFRAGPGGHAVDPETNLSCPVCTQELDSVAELEDHNKFYHQPLFG